MAGLDEPLEIPISGPLDLAMVLTSVAQVRLLLPGYNYGSEPGGTQDNSSHNTHSIGELNKTFPRPYCAPCYARPPTRRGLAPGLGVLCGDCPHKCISTWPLTVE